MKKTALILLSLAFLWHAAPALPAENNWLTGKWELWHDPDGDPKDWVEFTPDGKAISTNSDGRSLAGEYVVKDSEINIIYSYKGHSIPITLTYTPDKNKLFHYSERTRNTSEYRKVK
jgi:hypothetical protein